MDNHVSPGHEESISMFSSFEEVRNIIREDRGKLRSVMEFCEDSDTLLFFYNIPLGKYRHTPGLYGHKFKSGFIPKGFLGALFI